MSAKSSVRAPNSPPAKASAMERETIVLGKDILELISTAMYVDPMNIYREYVQNAADAVDAARLDGSLGRDEVGRIDIRLDSALRSIRISDNGAGLPWSQFAGRLTSLGASDKRGKAARGFRGIGRLAGLAYGQELVFRSRVPGETLVSEMRWDCRKLKAALRSNDFDGDLTDLIRHIVSVDQIPADGFPERFFEVELRGVIRLRADRLMTRMAVEQYLSQVAPAPFAPDFAFGKDIAAALSAVTDYNALHIHVDDSEEPLYRPHRNGFDAGNGRMIPFESVEIRELPDMDGGPAALVWVLHHPYEGAVPTGTLVKGFRMRSEDLQVGDGHILEELFAEPRFSSWAVGEIHVLDRKIVPNGRRDNFEQNVHHGNLFNQLSPVARDISKRCRTNSVRRNWLRKFQLSLNQAAEAVAVLGQGGISQSQRVHSAAAGAAAAAQAAKIAALPILKDSEPEKLISAATDAAAQVAIATKAPEVPSDPLATLPPEKREGYAHMLDLIYQCSPNRAVATKLVERILDRLRAGG
jgi:hypothetical protein